MSEEASYYERTVRQDNAFCRRAVRFHPELFTGDLSRFEETEPKPQPEPIVIPPLPDTALTIPIFNPWTQEWRQSPIGIAAHNQFRVAVRLVSEKHSVEPRVVLGLSRRRNVVKARRELIDILYAHGWGAAQIGRKLGRDHTTILHALKTGRDREAALAQGRARYFLRQERLAKREART